jgi:hypothetical protein
MQTKTGPARIACHAKLCRARNDPLGQGTVLLEGEAATRSRAPEIAFFENDCEAILSNGFVTPPSVERCGKAFFSTHRAYTASFRALSSGPSFHAYLESNTNLH